MFGKKLFVVTSIPSVYLGIYPTIALFTWFTEHIQIARVTNSILSRHSSRIDHHASATPSAQKYLKSYPSY